MSTVVKALSLLEHFDAETPEFGLTEMAHASGFDKATTRRLLVALASKGFLEQDPQTRRYRLGAMLVRLAHIREAHFPMMEIARPIAEALSRKSGETVHVSQMAGNVLSSVFVCESVQPIRVSVTLGMKLPLHCTASGVAFLSAAPEAFRTAVMKGPLPARTGNSASSPARLKKRIEETLTRGYAVNDQGFDVGVVSVASPILGANGAPVGALSITSPAVRANAAALKKHGARVREAAAQISAALGGRLAAA
jgi:IclR family transcriptional regulator, acetate operon repressor